MQVTEKQISRKSIKAGKVLRAIEKAAGKELPIVGPSKGKVLTAEVRKAKPKHVLEVGTLIGYSTILMGRVLGEGSEIVTIEIHRDEAETAGENVVEARILPKVTIIVGDARDVIPTLDGTFDFVFIDAEKREYLQYLRLAEPKFHVGTVVVADNVGVFAEQMNDYLYYIRRSGGYATRFVKVGDDGLEISVKL